MAVLKRSGVVDCWTAGTWRDGIAGPYWLDIEIATDRRDIQRKIERVLWYTGGRNSASSDYQRLRRRGVPIWVGTGKISG